MLKSKLTGNRNVKKMVEFQGFLPRLSDGGELVLISRLLLPTIPSSQSQSRRSSNFPYAV